MNQEKYIFDGNFGYSYSKYFKLVKVSESWKSKLDQTEIQPDPTEIQPKSNQIQWKSNQIKPKQTKILVNESQTQNPTEIKPNQAKS